MREAATLARPTVAPHLASVAQRVSALSGAMLVAYRLAFGAFGLAVVFVVGSSLLTGATPPSILALRLVKAAILLSVSIVLYRRRQHDPVAAMLSLAFLLWTITSSVDFAVAYHSWPALLDRIRFLLFALALLLFPDGEWHPRWTRHVAVASVAIFVVGALEALGLLGTHLFLPPAIACVLLAMAALWQRYRTSASLVKRQQLKWVALGLVGGISLILAARAGGALTAGMTMPPVSKLLLEGAFQLGIVLVALGFLTSLLRYRLYDAEAAISRSAALAALTVALVAVFAGTEAVIETVSQTYIPGGIGNVSGAIAAAVVAVLLSPLHSRISDWAEVHFHRDLAKLKAELPEVLAEHVGSFSPTAVAAAALPRIREAVQASRAAMLIDGTVIDAHGIAVAEARRRVRGREWDDCGALIQRDPGDDAFPLRLAIRCAHGSLRGWLMLGARPDGSLYGKDDLDALTAVAPALRQTIVAAREREKEKLREEKIHRATRRTLDTLAQRIVSLEAKLA